MQIVTVELNRGWNSRLGFSLQSNSDKGNTFISAIYKDSVAARDGRLKVGDHILMVNYSWKNILYIKIIYIIAFNVSWFYTQFYIFYCMKKYGLLMSYFIFLLCGWIYYFWFSVLIFLWKLYSNGLSFVYVCVII